MPGFAIRDPHRRPLSSSATELDGDESLNRALRHDHPVAGQELTDLHAGHTSRHPLLEAVSADGQRRPRLAMTISAVRAHDLNHPAQHHIGELLDTAIARDTCLDRGVDIAAHRLAVDPAEPGNRPQPLTSQPQPQHFSNLEHRNLPECHRRLSDCQQERRCSPVTAPN